MKVIDLTKESFVEKVADYQDIRKNGNLKATSPAW